jgi:hypothetical protein
MAKVEMAATLCGLLLAAACSECGSNKPVADLIELDGSVGRDFAPHPGDWREARRGDELAIGEGVRTAVQSGARVRMKRGRAGLRLGAETTVRFLDPATRTGLLKIETGEAEIDSGDQDLRFETSIGAASIERGAKVRARAGEDGVRLDVLIGRAQIERNGGERVRLEEGEGITVDIGGAIVERRGKAAAAAPDAGATDAVSVAAIDASAPDVGPDASGAQRESVSEKLRARIQRRAPKTADLDIEAGESVVVHNPKGATAVRVVFDKPCAGEALVEVSAREGYRSPIALGMGERSAIVLVPEGAHAYRVRCLRSSGPDPTASAQGRILVRRDSGAAVLPRSAARNVVDADGRRYTILYQNRLPEITVRWTRAPRSASSKYTLMISGPGKRNTVPEAESEEPVWTFPSGALQDGVHHVVFRAHDDAKAISPQTSIVIEFDNAAPNAQIREPRELATQLEPSLHVAGTALEGERVSVGATEIPLDPHQRFEADVALEDGHSTIAIRISHPTRGIHYYLRHLTPKER